MFPSAKEKEALPRCLLPANRKLKVIDCVLNFESVRELSLCLSSTIQRELIMTFLSGEGMNSTISGIDAVLKVQKPANDWEWYICR